MKYEIRPLDRAIVGSLAEVQRDSINGDLLVIGQGDKALVIKISDLVEEVRAIEDRKTKGVPEVVIND